MRVNPYTEGPRCRRKVRHIIHIKHVHYYCLNMSPSEENKIHSGKKLSGFYCVPIQNGVWINHFSNVFGPIEQNTEQKPIQDKLHKLETTIKDYQNPLDFPVAIKELQDKIKSQETKKAYSVDGILNEIIKFTDFKFQLAILKLFNIVLGSGIFPSMWNQGLIIPLHKSRDKFVPINYCGISVSSNMGKIMSLLKIASSINHKLAFYQNIVQQTASLL